MEKELYYIALAMNSQLNKNSFADILNTCGGVEGFFTESDKGWKAICNEYNIKTDIFDRRQLLEKAKKEQERMRKENIYITSYEHSDFPTLLTNCIDSPLILFYKGRLKVLQDNELILAFVGTRKASQRCKRLIEQIITDLHDMGHRPIIVSGLAYGIDICAHLSALKNNLTTYAVLGQGLDTVYPPSHTDFARQIVDAQGAIISELPCGSTYHKGIFLQRNRIIAGMSHAIIVGESPIKGGSMTSARIAFSYNREVFTIPGRPDDDMSKGCNLLIKTNIASLIENADDICNILDLPRKHREQLKLEDLFLDNESRIQCFPKEYYEIIKLFETYEYLSVNDICRNTGIVIHQLYKILFDMELKNIIFKSKGNLYSLKPKPEDKSIKKSRITP